MPLVQRVRQLVEAMAGPLGKATEPPEVGAQLSTPAFCKKGKGVADLQKIVPDLLHFRPELLQCGRSGTFRVAAVVVNVLADR